MNMFSLDSKLVPLDYCDVDAEPESNAYMILFLLTGLAVATYAFARFAESNNRLNYDSHVARILAGFLVLMTRMLHTRDGDLEIPNAENTLIAIGPHRTGWEALVVASKMKGTPPQFLTTTSFNSIPGVAAFLKMFKAIPVQASNSQNDDKRPSNGKALEDASKALDEKGCVALFPQGGFAKLGHEPPKVYAGAAKLAITNKIPIHVIRLDGFWCLQNPFIPLFVRNSTYYRAFLSMFHINNVRTTLCCVIDFHLKPENAELDDVKKINEICAQLYAYYSHTKELTTEEIGTIKTGISNKTHLSMWSKKIEQDDLGKKLITLKKEETELRETLIPMRLGG
jgi:1-acyl-sn-glycerol-3-phosphate acyltransferase